MASQLIHVRQFDHQSILVCPKFFKLDYSGEKVVVTKKDDNYRSCKELLFVGQTEEKMSSILLFVYFSFPI